jgi:hypothetical protein
VASLLTQPADRCGDLCRHLGSAELPPPARPTLAVGDLLSEGCSPHLAVVELNRGRVPPGVQLLGGQQGQLYGVGGAGASQQEFGDGAPWFGCHRLPGHYQQIDVAAVGLKQAVVPEPCRYTPTSSSPRITASSFARCSAKLTGRTVRGFTQQP